MGEGINDDASSQTLAGEKVVVNIGIMELPTKVEVQTNRMITGNSCDGVDSSVEHQTDHVTSLENMLNSSDDKAYIEKGSLSILGIENQYSEGTINK